MFSAGLLIPVLYCVSLLTTQVNSNVIRSPSHYPSLTFQVEPNNTPPSGDESFETWTGDASDSPRDDQELGAALTTTPGNSASFDAPQIPTSVWFKTFLPAPAALHFPNLFPNALSRFWSYALGHSELFHHHHHLPEPIDCSKYTIGEVLEWTLAHTPKPSEDDSHRPPPLHRLAWLVNISHPVKEALSDPNADLTLFAPDDKALTPPWKRHHPGHHNAYELSQENQGVDDDDSHVFWDAIEAIENESGCAHYRQEAYLEAGLDDDDKEKKKKFFLHAVELVLKYHVSPGRKTLREIGDRSTLPTALPISHDSDASHFRVRVGLPIHHREPGQLTLNFFSRFEAFKTRPIIAKNGVIYVIEKAPLLPPLSPLSQLFLFPKTTSTLTTALQKTHLDDVLLPRWGNKTIPLSAERSPSFDDGMDALDERVQSVFSSLIEGHGGELKKESFTVFAPTNRAFLGLGPKANLFLFSPFGQHILRYVLSYHIVPDIIWHTDYCEKTKHSVKCDLESKSYQTVERLPPFVQPPVQNRYFHPRQPLHPLPGKVNVTELHLPTLLGSRSNETLPISLVEFRHLGKGPIIRRAYIKQSNRDLIFGPPDKHAIPVTVPDAVAWGGALHIIPKLIHPPVPKEHRHRKDVQRALELSILTDV